MDGRFALLQAALWCLPTETKVLMNLFISHGFYHCREGVQQKVDLDAPPGAVKTFETYQLRSYASCAGAWYIHNALMVGMHWWLECIDVGLHWCWLHWWLVCTDSWFPLMLVCIDDWFALMIRWHWGLVCINAGSPWCWFASPLVCFDGWFTLMVRMHCCWLACLHWWLVCIDLVLHWWLVCIDDWFALLACNEGRGERRR